MEGEGPAVGVLEGFTNGKWECEAHSRWKKLGKKANSKRNRRRTVVVSDVVVEVRGGIYFEVVLWRGNILDVIPR